MASLLTTGCFGTPVGVKPMEPVAVQRELTRSILTSDSVSAPTRNLLFRQDLVDSWREPWSKVSVSALLRLDNPRCDLAKGEIFGHLTLEAGVARTTIEVQGRQIPLETETTAALAKASSRSWS